MLAKTHIDALRKMLGAKGAITDPDLIAPHLNEWRGKFFGKTALMLAPANSTEAAKAIAYCNLHKIALVPQGGNTGLVGGGLPGLGMQQELLMSSKRMNSVLEVDSINYSITAEAGCTIATLQDAAADAGLLFPLSLASEGSCTVGGIVSTNAGGVHVLRYGNTRALTLGLEAVLPNGDIYDGLKKLRKDNSGYALDQLLIGAEGTLGFVSKATFKLFPAEIQKHTLWLSVNSPTDALSLLTSAREASGDRVSVFEIMPHAGLMFVLDHITGMRNPLSQTSPWYVLLEIAANRNDPALSDQTEVWLEAMLNCGLIKDGAIAMSASQAKDFWRLRESMSEAQKHVGGSIKHDISVPISALPDFITETTAALEARFNDCRVTPFGHLGDGNLHFNVMQPENTDREIFLAHWSEMNQLVHDLVVDYGGSISAEHGIGSLKKYELARTKPLAEITAMKAIKAALDPNNIMNPNVMFV